MISSISSFGIISAIIPDSKIFFWIIASVADFAAVNPNGTGTLLANGLSTSFIKAKPVFNNGPRTLPENPPDCTILGRWIFDNFKLVH